MTVGNMENGIPVIAEGGKLSFAIDRGGTFTDVLCTFPTHPDLVHKYGHVTCRTFKLLSVNPSHYPDAPSEAIRVFLNQVFGLDKPRGEKIDSSRIGSVRMGTTVATNALLERHGEPCALITTQGLEDAILIGTQARPAIFDLKISRPEPIVSKIVGVRERVIVSPVTYPSKSTSSDVFASDANGSGDAENEEGTDSESQSTQDLVSPIPIKEFKQGITGETVAVLQDLDEQQLRLALRDLLSEGIKSVAFAFAHSYAFPEHEQLAEKIAKEEGFEFVSLSSALMPSVKIVPRAFTSCADAYLTPCIKAYLARFLQGFDSDFLTNVPLQFLQSDGGLTSAETFSGYRAVLSGPAGGVIGFSKTAFTPEHDSTSTSASSPSTDEGMIPGQAVIGFDMGGTSTDVSRFDGALEHVFENTTAGVVIQAPQLDINTVAAGGGSILDFSAGLLTAGPESASAFPGPACYRNNGPLTVTDANLILGRIQTSFFPHVFGPKQNLPLDQSASEGLFVELAKKINDFQARSVDVPVQGQTQTGTGEKGEKGKNDNTASSSPSTSPSNSNSVPVLSPLDVALGYLSVANETMCRPIRGLTESRGFDPSNHALACFGAAGGQHACNVASSLGIRTVHIHEHSGVLSAFGMGLANIAVEKQAPCLQVLSPEMLEAASKITRDLESLGTEELLQQLGSKASSSTFSTEVYFSLRYVGTDTQTMFSLPKEITTEFLALSSGPSSQESREAIVMSVLRLFEEGYAREYGFTLDRKVLLDSVRTRLVAHDDTFMTLSSKQAETETKTETETGTDVEKEMDTVATKVNNTPSETSLSLLQPLHVDSSLKSSYFGFLDTARPTLPSPKYLSQVYFPKTAVRPLQKLFPSHIVEVASPHQEGSDSTAVNIRGLWCQTPIYSIPDLRQGSFVAGPAILINATSTIVVDPEWAAVINKSSVVLHKIDYSLVNHGFDQLTSPIPLPSTDPGSGPCDPVMLSIFSHRFMSIAEQMGRVLQRSSVSTNIKERLDFSCALFGPDGGLVANAPHLPVHLGAMQEAVKSQIIHRGSSWNIGDVIVSNHPDMGGSHLPDITVITPVFLGKPGSGPSFFVASRGHHSDIGGSVPGSMPPFSHTLAEEGVAIRSFLLVDGKTGKMCLNEITDVLNCNVDSEGNAILVPEGSEKPIGARNIRDNLSDLQAQVAANQRGVALLTTLAASYSLPVVQSFMYFIREAAAEAVREMLCQVSKKAGLPSRGTLPTITDYMDDGTPICLTITIDRETREAVFDFSGTGPAVDGNTNSPRSVALSAVIYALRCLVSKDIPLNQGCLSPVEVVIPENSILNPPQGAAIVGGNVLTSQRVTDVVLKAFHACAASQGCMNNFCFGNDEFGYYETIAGGAGAGKGWKGASGVHTHMTNTRITDPEVLERRYPVLLRMFKIRLGSGGEGRWNGGDGVKREVQFLRPMFVSLLTERREKSPFGMDGGGDGEKGENYLVSYTSEAPTGAVKDDEKDYFSESYLGRTVSALPGKIGLPVEAGQGILINTPGGGAWGLASEKHENDDKDMSEGYKIPPKTGSLASYSSNQESA